MADPIPALFKLSLDALIEHVKNKKLKFSPDEIPPTIHNMLWNDSTVLNLIINTCHPETRNWFSTRVIQIPPVITVGFCQNIVGKHCQVKIRFENRATVTWTLASLHWPQYPSPKFIIRTGNQYISTRTDFRSRNFTSLLSNYNRSRFEVVNWICKVFRCEISELILDYCVDEQVLKWPKLKTVSTLKIKEYKNLEVLKELIVERHKNGLRTKFDEVKISTPAQKEFLPFIDFTRAGINFSNLRIDQLIEEFRVLSQRKHCLAVARTRNLSNEDFEFFKAQLGFSDRSTTSMVVHEETNTRLRVVSELKDGKLTKFRFLEKEPGVYWAIGMNVD
ncbi:unnamed protein product [Caenorhabditis brenneri]